MPILDKPISRAEYYAQRYDKEAADKKKAEEEAIKKRLEQTTSTLTDTPTISQQIFPNTQITRPSDTQKVYNKDIIDINYGRNKGRYKITATPTTTITTGGISQAPTKKQGTLRTGYTNIGLIEQNILEKQADLKRKDRSRQEKYQLRRTYLTLGGIGVIKGVTTPIIYPKETIKGIFNAITKPKQAVKNIITEAKVNPAGLTGSFIGTGILLKGIGGAGVVARNTKIKLTTDTVESSTYLDVTSSSKVLQGQSAFPTTNSISNAMKRFDYKLGKTYKVGSASPEPLQNIPFSKTVIVGKGTGVMRTEGLYVSPYTEGSSYFFNIRKDTGYSISLLPKFSSKPTLSIISLDRKVMRMPKNILMQGVDYENLFLQTQGKSGTGRAFISGNSERMFNPKLPKAFKTSETEAVIPAGSMLRKSGSDSLSFKFSYQRIPVKEYKLITSDFGKTSKFKGASFDNPLVKKGRYDAKTNTYYSPKTNISVSGYTSRIGLGSMKFGSSSGKSSSMRSVGYSINSYSSRMSSNKFLSRMSSSGSSSRIYSKGYSSSNRSSSRSSTGSSRSYSGSSSIIPTPKIIIPNYSSKKYNIVPSSKKLFSGSIVPKYKYISSIESRIFNIRGKTTKRQSSSGLIIRPVIV